MNTQELKSSLGGLYQEWEVATRPAYYSYQLSIGKRKAVLHSAMQTYLPRLRELERGIIEWADETSARGPAEAKMWKLSATMRRAITNTDPDNIKVLFPV